MLRKLLIFLLIIIILMVLFGNKQNVTQWGGEFVLYQELPPDNSRRLHPLGYLTKYSFIHPNGKIVATRHTTPTRQHMHDAVNTNTTIDKRDNNPYGRYYYYADKFDYKPYDWRPFEWRPYWLRRADLEPSARNCTEFATDNCIGLGSSDYQSCYDLQHNKCPFNPTRN